MKELNYDLLILGGGPAGMSAAIYAARGNLKTAIIDTSILGGQVNNTLEIENYPGFGLIGGFDLIQKLEDHVDKFNVDKHIMQEVKKVNLLGEEKMVETEEAIFKGKSIIVATGAQPAKLGVSGEQELLGRGVSYCAVCDGAFFREKVVTVVGGGNAAIEEALYLTKFASKVNVVHRRDQLRADKMYQERAFKDPKINFIWDTVVKEIKGAEKVEKLVVKNVKTNGISEVATDGIFPYVGFSANTEMFTEQLELDPTGFINTDISLLTNIEGVFAAGDVRVTPLRQVIVSAADGAISANAAIRYIESKETVLTK